jgi:hypothetical protein
MTPTFTTKDIRRISKHLNMRPKDFKERWLRYEKKDDDWMNINTALPVFRSLNQYVFYL